MKYLPFENITLHTQLSVEEVIERLSENLEPRKYSPFNNRTLKKIFAGHIEHNTFNISRWVRYGKYSNTIIKGELYEDGNTATTIEVKVRLHLLICIIVIFACSTLLITGFIPNYPFLIQNLFTILFIYVIIIGQFNRDSTQSKKHLVELFEAEIE